jgi:hypothetical protein
MVIGSRYSAGGRAQRRNRNRAGVVRIVLVRIPLASSRSRALSLGWDIQHPLTGGQQLLGQQMTHALRTRDGQGRSGHT